MTQVTQLEQDFEALTQLPQPPERMPEYNTQKEATGQQLEPDQKLSCKLTKPVEYLNL